MYLSVMTNYLVFIQIILRNISCNQQDRTVAWISVIFFKKKKKKESVWSPPVTTVQLLKHAGK